MFFHVSWLIIFETLKQSDTQYTFISHNQNVDETDYDVFPKTRFISNIDHESKTTTSDSRDCIRKCNDLKSECQCINIYKDSNGTTCYFYSVSEGRFLGDSRFTFVIKVQVNK